MNIKLTITAALVTVSTALGIIQSQWQKEHHGKQDMTMDVVMHNYRSLQGILTNQTKVQALIHNL
jgi:hypothetical protein